MINLPILAARNVLRNKFRAAMTVAGVAVAVLTFMLLRTVVSAWTSLLFLHRMTDVLAGIKAWSRPAIEAARPRIDGFAYEIEIPVRALRRGFRVVDVPVTTDKRRGGRSHVRSLAGEGAGMLWAALALRLGLV